MANINDNKETSKSQCDKILAYMMQGNRITALEALIKFQCMRLASRICDLRAIGHDIKCERIRVESGKYVASYWLDESELQVQ